MNSLVLLEKLINKEDLSAQEVLMLLKECLDNTLTESQVAAFLISLRMKGETIEEISGLIQGMRELMIPFPINSYGIDTCGTGGDGLGTFNISTTVAFVVAGAGIPIIKHGNRAASSQCGSADVLAELGVHIMLAPEQAKKVFEKVGMIFLFAPLYHPAMKKIAPVRKALQTRTVFNYLGPFLNPARVRRQIIGVSNTEIAKKMAEVARKFSYEHLLIISSERGLDEIDITGKTTLIEIKGESISTKHIDPSIFGFKKSSLNAIQGGTAKNNSQIIMEILNGKKNVKRDIVVFNSAYAMYIADKVKSIEEGILLAERVIDSGAALLVLNNLIKESQKYASKN